MRSCESEGNLGQNCGLADLTVACFGFPGKSPLARQPDVYFTTRSQGHRRHLPGKVALRRPVSTSASSRGALEPGPRPHPRICRSAQMVVSAAVRAGADQGRRVPPVPLTSVQSLRLRPSQAACLRLRGFAPHVWTDAGPTQPWRIVIVDLAQLVTRWPSRRSREETGAGLVERPWHRERVAALTGQQPGWSVGSRSVSCPPRPRSHPPGREG
jgi:hypothetical protein